MGTPEIIAISILGLIISLAVLYAIIKSAVKSGNKEILKFLIYKLRRDGVTKEEIYKLYNEDISKIL